MKRRTRLVLFFLSLLFGVIKSGNAHAQCNNWTISAHILTTSTCTGNGSFSAAISGPDASNLTNIQYGVPVAANGFSVPLNNSATFNNIPGGAYQVSAVATCNGTFVGKNTSVTMPGDYYPPTLTASMARGSLSCGAYGQISLNIINGRPPFSVHITSAPANYTGPYTFTSSASYDNITGLPPGNYTLQVVDVCNSGTTPVNITVASLDASTVPLQYNSAIQNAGCDTLIIPNPQINEFNNGWQAYENDTLFKVSFHIGNLVAATPFQNLNTQTTLKLPAGKSLKDFYGQTITYDIKTPCGSDVTYTHIIFFPAIVVGIDQNCNVNFKSTLAFTSPVCYPVTYSIISSTGVNYGTHIATAPNDPMPTLPIGSYNLSYTTGDGYTGTGSFGTSPIVGNPYSVSIISGGNGLNNYIQGFNFQTGISSSSKKIVELFSGPTGYSYFDSSWTNDNLYTVIQNQTPTVPGSIKFPAGNYVWKITDNCGSYLLPITVGAPDLTQYTIGALHTRQTCQGLWVSVNGTAKTNGQNDQFQYAVIVDGNGWLSGTAINGGDSILLTTPGSYTFVATNDGLPVLIDSSYYYVGYSSLYNIGYTFNYTITPVAADLDSSQGFLCKGAGSGQAVIYVKGQGGIPFKAPVHYKYYLAHQGNGLDGPYITSNITGVFTNFGGNANDMYDIRIEDSCGAFAVQTLKILDLQHARLISNSTYTPCDNSSVQLTAVYLPGATYSWVGPNGFVSSLRDPVINNVGAQNGGVYHVTIITPQCMQPVADSTILVVNANPPKPLVSLVCDPRPPALTITNPSPGYSYNWEIGLNIDGYIGSFDFPSDTNYTKYMNILGSYKAIATDTTTGCFTNSDSVTAYTDPSVPLQAVVYSPHLQICTGDTTILVAQGAVPAAKYQWFKNDTVIAGATYNSYIAWLPGDYKVAINAGVCEIDTSASVTVSVVATPSATISAPVQEICMGDTAFLHVNTGPGYTYTWSLNDTTIPGSNTAILDATRQGTYKVIVSNGGCVAVSTNIAITVDPAIIVNLVPGTDQLLCMGDTVYFSTPANAAYIYTWQKDGAIIPGANTHAYKAASTGTYMVSVKTNACPPVSSPPVAVTVSPPVTATISAPVQEVCMGDTAFIYADTGLGYIYTWYRNGSIINGSTTATLGATQRGSYKVYISDGGCNATSVTVTVAVDSAPVVNLIPGADQSICTGDVVHFSTPANPAYTYTWQRNGAVIATANVNAYQASFGGTYMVSVRSGICPVVSSQSVTVALLPSGVQLRGDTTICTPGAIAIPLSIDSGFAQALWSTGETTNSIMAVAAGTYWVQAADQCGTFSDTMHIFTPADYIIHLPDDTLICNSTNSTILSVPAILKNILWSNGNSSSTTVINGPGTYWVQGQSPCGTERDTVRVSFCAPVIHSIQLSKDTICAGDCIDVSAATGNYPQQYYWSFNGGFPDSSNAQDPGTICYGKEGVYNIGLKVANAGGSDILATQVVVLSKPAPRFADTTVTVPYESNVMLPACADALLVSWYKDDSLICTNCQSIDIDARYYYSVYHCVVSNGGCKDSCSYKLQVIDIPHDLWLPDAFTPNGDGRNDVFHIITDNPNIQVTGLEVYNRWGQLIFVSHLSNDGWDGTVHGIPADMDTYNWMLKYRIYGQPEVYFKKGSVVLIR